MAIVNKKILSFSINYLPWDGRLTSSGHPIMGKLTNPVAVGKPDIPPPLGQTTDWCIILLRYIDQIYCYIINILY
jgi:hypothetical protein